jgi:predicted nuclease of predicted toxin-antitoxin system
VKLLLDENLSPRLIESLSDLYPGSEHVNNCGLGSAEDSAVWEYAMAHGFSIVSKDSDFAERSVLYSDSPKIIWVRIGNCSTAEIEEVLRSANDMIRKFIEHDRETCLLLSRHQTRRSLAEARQL